MNSSAERLLAIDDVTEQFLREFGHLHRDQLNTRISSGTWSIAQNIEHLIKVNETYYPVIDSVRKGTYELPFFGRMPFMIRFFGRFILKAVDPDRRKKIKTFPLWEPSKSDIDSAILARFASHQEQLKELLKKSEDLVQEKP